MDKTQVRIHGTAADTPIRSDSEGWHIWLTYYPVRDRSLYPVRVGFGALWEQMRDEGIFRNAIKPTDVDLQ